MTSLIQRMYGASAAASVHNREDIDNENISISLNDVAFHGELK